MPRLAGRDVNGSVAVRVHSGPRPRTFKEKVDPDPDQSRGRFVGFESRIVKEKVKLDLKPELYIGRV